MHNAIWKPQELNACVLFSGGLCITSRPALFQGDVVHDFLCSTHKYAVIVCFLLRDYSTYTTCSQVVHVMYMPCTLPQILQLTLTSICRSDQPQNQRSVMFITWTTNYTTLVLSYLQCATLFPIFIDAGSRYQLGYCG